MIIGNITIFIRKLQEYITRYVYKLAPPPTFEINARPLTQGRIQTVANDLHKSLNFFIDKANMEQNIEKLLTTCVTMIDFSL